jgi:hypothetical protein
MKDKVISLGKGSKEKTPQNLTPRFVEDLAIKIMEGNKNVEMFQAMAIISFKMGNLGSEIKSLRTRLTTVEEKKQQLSQHLYKD